MVSMKTHRFILFIYGLLITASVWAAGKKEVEAVTMVSYEQGWSDSEGTLALKNNTNEDVRNVTFLMTYLDMSGRQLDYEEYTLQVNIKPGMTKKVDIPAYEHDREYAYYTSEALYPSRKFKVKYELKDYNVVAEATDQGVDLTDDDSSSSDAYSRGMGEGMSILIGLLALVVVLGIVVGMYALVGSMARDRNRSATLWILASIIGNPLLIIIILLCIGNADDTEKKESY